MASQDVEAARKFYTRISRVYDAIADSSEHVARDLGLELLAAQHDERILEIGSGTGAAIIQLARAVGVRGHVVGIDLSEGMHDVADERLASSGLSTIADLRVACIPPIPAGDRSFDAAFMAFTLELFPDEVITTVLQEIRRILRPGGRLVVVGMNEEDAAGRPGLAERTYWWLHRHFPHIIDCRPINVVRVLREAGLTVTRIETVEICGLPVCVCVSQSGQRSSVSTVQ